MRYSIHLTAIPNQRAHTIVAHNLAGNRNVSLSYAQSLLENFPVVYMADVSHDDAETILRQLRKIGVQAHGVPLQRAAQPLIKNEEAPLSTEQPAPEPAVVPSSPAPIAAKTSFVFREEPPVKMREKKTIPWKSLGALALMGVIVICAAVFFTKSQWALAVRPTSGAPDPADNAPKKGNGAGASALSSNSDSALRQTGDEPIAERDKTRAQAYADSAKLCSGCEGAIAFYTMAIGINKRNIAAWSGLADAYDQCDKQEKTRWAREEMQRIFGDKIVYLAAIVGQYGTLRDYRLDAANAYRIEYRSRAIDTQSQLMEIYKIISAFGPQCGCSAFSVYAAMDATRGMVVSIKNDQSVTTLEQFKRFAVIKHID